MAINKKSDSFANFAALGFAESAANTQTTTKFAFPFSIMDKMALVINRIEYWTGTYAALAAAADIFYLAITASASVTNIANQADPLIIDNMAFTRADFGAAASGQVIATPFIKDFSSLPGGGLLVAPAPLYALIQGVGCGSAVTAYFKLFYTYMELSSDEYWQLVESRRIISS